MTHALVPVYMESLATLPYCSVLHAAFEGAKVCVVDAGPSSIMEQLKRPLR